MNSKEYQEWEQRRDEYINSHYQLRLSCNNCDKERYISVKKGTPVWYAILFETEDCPNCGSHSWSKHLFQ